MRHSGRYGHGGKTGSAGQQPSWAGGVYQLKHSLRQLQISTGCWAEALQVVPRLESSEPADNV